MTTTAAAAGTRRHTGIYPAEPRQVGLARTALAGWLGGCPQADEVILVASEFATNSVLHSASRGSRGLTMTSDGLRLLHDLHRSPFDPPRQLRPRTAATGQPAGGSGTVSTVA